MLTKLSGRGFNNLFFDKIGMGHTKEAAVSIESFMRKKVRQESFLSNKIMTEQFITNDDLDKDLNLDRIRKIIEIEPDSTALSISFRGLPPSTYMTQDGAECLFGTIITEEMIKNITELRTRDNDLRKIVKDNQVKDLLVEQDGKFIEGCEKIVTDFPDKHQLFPDGLTKNSFVEASKFLPSLHIPTGCVLMNEATSKDLLKWDASDVGYETVREQHTEGLTNSKIQGYKLYITIENDIVKDNIIWFFAREDFLGKFFTLEDTTVVMKVEGLYVSFYSYKIMGVTIANTDGVYKADFNV